MQCVIRERTRIDVLPDLRPAPIEEWTQFIESILVVPLKRLAARTVRRVLTTDAGDPGGEAGDGATEWLDFADVAAREAGVEVAAKPIDAVSGDKLLEREGVRVHDPDAPVIAAL